jgi:hypothetical protein
MKDPKTTEQKTPAPTTKQEIVEKLRDLSLEDLDVVSGGNAARCDMDQPPVA